MRKFFIASSFICFLILTPTILFAQNDDKKKDNKTEKKECKEDSCKKPQKKN